jgi:hypothetical protein
VLERPRVRSSARGGPQRTIDLPPPLCRPVVLLLLAAADTDADAEAAQVGVASLDPLVVRTPAHRTGYVRPPPPLLRINVDKPRSSCCPCLWLYSCCFVVVVVVLAVVVDGGAQFVCSRSRPSSCVDGEARRGVLDRRSQTREGIRLGRAEAEKSSEFDVRPRLQQQQQQRRELDGRSV